VEASLRQPLSGRLPQSRPGQGWILKGLLLLVAASSLISDGGRSVLQVPTGPPSASPPLSGRESLNELEVLLARGQSRRVMVGLARRFAADPTDVRAGLTLVRATRIAGRTDWLRGFLGAAQRRVPTAAVYAALAELSYSESQHARGFALATTAYLARPTDPAVAFSYATGVAASGKVAIAFAILEPWLLDRATWPDFGLSTVQRLAAFAAAGAPASTGRVAANLWVSESWKRADGSARARGLALASSLEAIGSESPAAARLARRAVLAGVEGGELSSVAAAIIALAEASQSQDSAGPSSLAGVCASLPGPETLVQTDCLVSALELAWRQGSLGAAADIYEDLRDRKLGNPLVGTRLGVVGIPLLESLGEFQEAALLADRSASAASAMGLPDLEVNFLVRLAGARRMTGDAVGAYEAASTAVSLAAEQSTDQLLRALVEASDAASAVGDGRQAQALIERADRVAFPEAEPVASVSLRRLRLRLKAAGVRGLADELEGYAGLGGLGPSGAPRSTAARVHEPYLRLMENATAAAALEEQALPEPALEKYLEAILSFERLTEGISNRRSRILISDAWQDLLRHAMSAAFRAGRIDVAVELLEKARGWGEPAPARLADHRPSPFPRQGAAIVYAVGPDDVWAVTLRADDLPQALRLPISTQALRERVRLWRALSIHPVDLHMRRQLGLELYEALVAPLLTEAPAGAPTLYLVPDDVLHLLPFSSLPVNENGAALFDRYAVTQTPSLSLLLRVLSTPPADGPWVAFGPNGGADTIAEMHAATATGGITFLGPRATEGRWLDVAQTASVIHFGGHAMAPSSSWSGGWLRLRGDTAEDGLVTIPEIMETPLSGSTVVLLACDSATRSAEPGSAGHYSLYPSIGEAFLVSGARSVIGNLWPVTERDAQLLATEFYRAGGPAVGVAALDRARRRLRELSPDNPASWAGAVWLGAPTPSSRGASSR